MSDLSEEVRVQVARFRHLLIDVGRRGIFSSPLAAPVEGDIEPLHFEALWWLRAEGFLTINLLAERLGGIAMPRMSRLVDRLEEMELVARVKIMRHDRRHVSVRLTDKGRALSEQVDGIVQERMAKLLLPLPGEDRSALMDLLERWVEALGQATQQVDSESLTLSASDS
ncbi:MarR family winged helix-turn-helix transcriptional regulator [Hyalangium versicolor]|uniref:MarR family winged helix-turn-helix transcriptional regulator n=1 Tax=Hyalangium versicolor TaxID=2861190 RepID=UPI001CCD7B94|nr:MarR family winged helix-turn-helix transcriptional regulator [Hyalangium versicolor]